MIAMTICVTNCLHWIGFHIVNRLLEDGYQVDGITGMDSDREEELSLMLGRNSLFSLYETENQIKDKSYTGLVLVDEAKRNFIQSEKTFTIGKNRRNETGLINIELPLLFGEWMPMDAHGVYANNQYVKFDSNKFRNDAIYIDDFIDCFMQWIKIPDLPKTIALTKDKKLIKDQQSLGIQMYIREDRPKDEQVSKVIQHYEKLQRFKLF